MAEFEPFTEEEYEQTKLVDFKFLLTLQMNDCRKILNQAITAPAIDILKDMVDCFESLMNAFTDEKYGDAIKNLVTKHESYLKTLNNKARFEQELILKKQFYRKKFEMLVALATRKGFTVMKDTTISIRK
jgi:hypothetical protein